MKELEYEKFKPYEVDPESIGFLRSSEFEKSIDHKFVFSNGYGASVVKNNRSYGHEQDLFELALLRRFRDNDYRFYYNSHIAKNVLANLTNEQVLETLEKIKNLPEEESIQDRDDYDSYFYDDEDDDEDWDDEEDDIDINDILNFVGEKIEKEMKKAAIEEAIGQHKDELTKMYDIKTLFKELGTDMINTSEIIDEMLKLTTNPSEFCLVDDLDKYLNDYNVKMQTNILMTVNKMNVLAELIKDMNTNSEEGDE